METVGFRLDDRLERELRLLLGSTGPNGYNEKHRVDLIDGKLTVEVRSNEHPPPHFHVRYNGEDASFCILTGRRLPKARGLERHEKMIQLWWSKHKRTIAIYWNESRPAGCKVGTVPIPDEP
ncbi:DUF4160 domain-containing protein [Ensifer sp. NPDC090286]|uniref:DUF4160 domain-containing protein n=1 Tax=Ensifer sp. NPDC090286 TaxID=3363991 RepID=UPI00383AF291